MKTLEVYKLHNRMRNKLPILRMGLPSITYCYSDTFLESSTFLI